jgi:uncharacterized protein with NRDE domain
MCLLVVAWRIHADYPLILAGNRDEFHDRPAAPLGQWSDRPGIAGGRDLQAGGTWLAAASAGKLGVVTNFRDTTSRPPSDAPSRGELVVDYLSRPQSAARFAADLEPRATRYAGFNLLLADTHDLVYLSNRVPHGARALPSGFYGLSNGALDEPWPKLIRARERFRAAVSASQPEVAELFALLADRTPATEPAMPDLPPDWQQALSAPFVVHDRYGTRCTSVVLIDRNGHATMHERRFDSTGTQTGASRLELGGHEAASQPAGSNVRPPAAQPATTCPE